MLKDFRESFAPALNDPEFQREFIAAAYEEEGVEGVLRALREIAAASRRMTKIADSAGVSRTSLYRSLRQGSNPAFKTVVAVLNTLDLDFAVVPKNGRNKENANALE